MKLGKSFTSKWKHVEGKRSDLIQLDEVST